MKQINPTYKHTIALSPLKRELLNVLAYFGVFNHPLTAAELQNLARNYYAFSHVQNALYEMVGQNFCTVYKGYFTLSNNAKQAVSARSEKEEFAKSFFNKLPFYARLISAFPYVRGVAVSGSLSKGVMHADGDIDYFIVTAHNRLWLTRIWLVLFKKIFLFNSRKYFCVNYFVSEKHLQIPDQNRFTATEIVTLLPVFNAEIFTHFKAANTFIKGYYGHFEHPISIPVQKRRIEFFKPFAEWLFNNKIGDFLDIISMHITVWRWHIKFKTFDRNKFGLTLRSTRNVSKHHPRDFQTVVLNKMEEILMNASEKIVGAKR